MLPLLREILTEHKAASENAGPDDPVFVTSAGSPRSRHNLCHDVVEAVVAHANKLVEERGLQPLPIGITPHKLRHTFASILVAIGKDPTYVMQQLGAHRPGVHAARLRAHDATQRGGTRAAQGARRGARLGTHWAQTGESAPARAAGPLLKYRKPPR